MRPIDRLSVNAASAQPDDDELRRCLTIICSKWKPAGLLTWRNGLSAIPRSPTGYGVLEGSPPGRGGGGGHSGRSDRKIGERRRARAR